MTKNTVPPRRPDDRTGPARASAAGALLLSLAAAPAVAAAGSLAAPSATPAPPPVGIAGDGEEEAATCRAAGTAALDPTRVEMSATRRARGGSGVMRLRLSASPFGVALEEDGSYRYHLEVAVEDLPPLPDGTYVVWAATPDLDEHRKLGAVGPSGRVTGEVAWNKFMAFVTVEPSADVKSWSQSIVLSARSPSGRMHTMAGHGPFSGEPCLDPRP